MRPAEESPTTPVGRTQWKEPGGPASCGRGQLLAFLFEQHRAEHVDFAVGLFEAPVSRNDKVGAARFLACRELCREAFSCRIPRDPISSHQTVKLRHRLARRHGYAVELSLSSGLEQKGNSRYPDGQPLCGQLLEPGINCFADPGMDNSFQRCAFAGVVEDPLGESDPV